MKEIASNFINISTESQLKSYLKAYSKSCLYNINKSNLEIICLVPTRLKRKLKRNIGFLIPVGIILNVLSLKEKKKDNLKKVK